MLLITQEYTSPATQSSSLVSMALESNMPRPRVRIENRQTPTFQLTASSLNSVAENYVQSLQGTTEALDASRTGLTRNLRATDCPDIYKEMMEYALFSL